MRIQLYVPPGGYFAERWSRGSSMPPLGLLSIGAVLKRDGVDVEVVPADVLGMSFRDIGRKIAADRPDVVGVTSTTENRFQSFKLLEVARRARPEALTVIGGPHASMAPEDTLAHIDALDAVACGEAEETVRELCRALDGRGRDLAALEGVRGLWVRRGGTPVFTGPRPVVEDLDALPFPDFGLVPFDRYNFRVDVPGHGLLPAVNVMTSRGCPFNCNFCATPVNWGRKVRVRSPENVVDEIEGHVRERGARVIFFYDDTFNVGAARVERICDLIIERRLNVFWRAEVRLDLMSRDLLAKMKAAGLFHVSFGLEAGSERVRNEVVGKKLDIEDFHNMVRWCREVGVIPNAFFIFSHPTETWDEARQTAAIIERYRGEVESTIAVLHVYPGTPLEATAREKGLLPPGFTWTKRYRRRVITLPTAQGDVPLFLDKLTWAQVSELLFRWSQSGGNISILRKVPRTLLRIRSVGEAKRYVIMAVVWARLKLRRLRRRGAPASS